MYRKILDVLTILSTILVLGILGGGFFTYKYVTSPEFERNVKNKLMGDLEKKMPKVTGPMVEMSNDSKQFWDYIEKRNREHIEWETKGKWEQ